MRFWDASAVVALLVAESTTTAMMSLATTDPEMLVWWATEVECASAVARLEGDGALREPAAAEAFDRLRQLALSWHEVEPGDAVREAAVRLLRAPTSGRRCPATGGGLRRVGGATVVAGPHHP